MCVCACVLCVNFAGKFVPNEWLGSFSCVMVACPCLGMLICTRSRAVFTC